MTAFPSFPIEKTHFVPVTCRRTRGLAHAPACAVTRLPFPGFSEVWTPSHVDHQACAITHAPPYPAAPRGWCLLAISTWGSTAGK